MSFEPGDRLGDRLRLERLVGRGASGEVWAAEHLRLGARVAVKILDTSLTERADMQQRFLHEARAVAQIGSPHVVSVHDCDITPGGNPYIVMELLQGESLDVRLQRLGPLPFGEVVDAVEQTCRALAAAHARGVIHRDVKPANVFLVAWHQGLVFKLIDFGIAKHPAIASLELTATGTLLGTPKYMSPEQLDDPRRIDHRADLWSLAVVAFECLTGKLPFPSESLVSLALAQKRGEHTPASHYRAELAESVDRWFARAFTPDIQRRFQTAAELASALRNATPAPQSVDRRVAEGRNFAIGPTVPQPISIETVVVPPTGIQYSDMGTTVELDTSGAQPPASLQSTVALESPMMSPLASAEHPPASLDLGATVHDPSLLAMPPSVSVQAQYARPPMPPQLAPSSFARRATNRASAATAVVLAGLTLGIIALAVVWWFWR